MAVYTKLDGAQIAAFLAGYDIGTYRSHREIAEGVENSNYLVETDRDRFILTLYEKRVAPADLPFFLGLMEHLSARGVICPLPVKDRGGVVLGRLAERPAAIVTFLAGAWSRDTTPGRCRQVGEALARLHKAGNGFALTRENALGMRGWRPLFERFRSSADTIAAGLAGEIAGELEQLEAVWPKSLPRGVIHADLFPDNVFFTGETLSGLIDFYFACNDAHAYDLAVSLNAWCFSPEVAYEPQKGAAMIEGYQSVRRLTPEERAALPTLARGAALRFLLTRAYDWINTPADALVTPHDPIPYLKRLLVHRTLTSAQAYGCDLA